MATATARRTGAPGRRPVAALGDPDVIYGAPPRPWPLAIPRSDADSPARARWIGLLLDDPARARRERLRAAMQYWKQRLELLEARLAAAEEALARALEPPRPDEDGNLPPPVPAVEIWRLRCEAAAAWADVQHAGSRLAELKQGLRPGAR